MSTWAKDNWRQNKEKIRSIMSSTFDITDPNGVQYTTNRLEEFCRVNNLPYTTIWKNSMEPQPIKRGRAKGWKCMKRNHDGLFQIF